MDPAGEPWSHAAGVDLRNKPHRMQDTLGLQRVVADSVTLDNGGNDLVDSNRPGPHAWSLPPSMVGTRRSAETAKTSGSLGSGSKVASTESP